jgi:hypothetical protein
VNRHALDAYIIKKCAESWDEKLVAGISNKNNCSGFVKAVAGNLNVQLPPMQADGILDAIEI